MKRSEMLNKLAEQLYGYMIHSEHAAESIAKEVLTMIENEGMLPPIYSTVLDSDYQRQTNTPPQYSFKCEWEPENGK